MEFPSNIREKLEQLLQHEDINTLTKAAERLSENYRREAHISASSRIEILAYSAVRMPATFGAVSRALELSLGGLSGEITSVLDVGAGTGAAAIAAEALTDCGDILCLERDRDMLELGKLFAENARWQERDVTSAELTETADLVICSYCLNELPEAQRKPVTAALANAAKKLLLIVEPGTPKAFADLKQTRQQLIGLGMRITAPCPTNTACPLPSGDWCHFTVRIARSKLHKRLKGADVPYEDEKFCFLAAKWENPEESGEKIGEKSAIILRRPLIEPGKITLHLCSENGITEKLVTRGSPLFKMARKSDPGDTFPIG